MKIIARSRARAKRPTSKVFRLSEVGKTKDAASRVVYTEFVCANCGHSHSLHVPPEEETAGRWGCMHEDAGNNAGGAGDWCHCRGYRARKGAA
jgi:hypothetical protein